MPEQPHPRFRLPLQVPAVIATSSTPASPVRADFCTNRIGARGRGLCLRSILVLKGALNGTAPGHLFRRPLPPSFLHLVLARCLPARHPRDGPRPLQPDLRLRPPLLFLNLLLLLRRRRLVRSSLTCWRSRSKASQKLCRLCSSSSRRHQYAWKGCPRNTKIRRQGGPLGPAAPSFLGK